MRYGPLGKTGLQVSAMGLGTWQFGGEWGRRFDRSEVAELVRRAAELGINLIDTAECYGDHEAELLVGSAIAGRRDDWIIATKFGHRFHQDRMTAGGGRLEPYGRITGQRRPSLSSSTGRWRRWAPTTSSSTCSTAAATRFSIATTSGRC